MGREFGGIEVTLLWDGTLAERFVPASARISASETSWSQM